jgi:hypothetical protein
MMSEATHRAGERRISLPGPARARARLIRLETAKDFRDVRFPYVRRVGAP